MTYDANPETEGPPNIMDEQLIQAIEEDAEKQGFQEFHFHDLFGHRAWLCPKCICIVGNPRLHREVCCAR